VEENDYTVLTFDDLEYELGLAEGNIRKKIAFVENQVGLSAHIQIFEADCRWFRLHIPISLLLNWKNLRLLSNTLIRMIRMYVPLPGL